MYVVYVRISIRGMPLNKTLAVINYSPHRNDYTIGPLFLRCPMYFYGWMKR